MKRNRQKRHGIPRSDTSFRENVLFHYLQLFCYFCTFITYSYVIALEKSYQSFSSIRKYSIILKIVWGANTLQSSIYLQTLHSNILKSKIIALLKGKSEQQYIVFTVKKNLRFIKIHWKRSQFPINDSNNRNLFKNIKYKEQLSIMVENIKF